MIKVTLPTLRKILFVVVLVAISGVFGYRLGLKQGVVGQESVATSLDRTIPEGKPASFSLFWQAWDDLYRLYVDKSHLNQTELIYGAIRGMVAAAGDPYTAFFPPTDNKEMKEDLGGSFGGVGIELGFKGETLAVISPLSGNPAEKAGVKAGDLILRITDTQKKIDRPTDGISLPEAVNIIRGATGTQVTLTLLRSAQEKPFTVTLTRDTIVVKTVELKFEKVKCKSQKGLPDCQVPVIKVNRFGEKTDVEWDQAVEQIKAIEAKATVLGIVLDLRNNPGGFLDQAVNLASDFMSSGVVVWQQYASGEKSGLSVTRSPRLSGVKLVVLINSGSASAAEILAGALSEKAGGILVGEKSFGKGTVQQPEDLPGGSGLHITIARWLLPSGKSIDKVGITPGVIVKPDEKDVTNDLQLKKAVQLVLNP